MLYHKTLYQKKLDAQAADFIKERLPYRAKIELRMPKYINVNENGAWKSVQVPNLVYGTIEKIDHINITLRQDGNGLEIISFEHVQKISPYETPKD